MSKGTIIAWIGVLFSIAAFSQTSLERKALTSIQKGKWERARAQLAKSRQKDPTSPSTWYLWSAYYFAPANPDFQIDSAYQNAMVAMEKYVALNPKLRERLRKFPLDSIILVEWREQIDSAAFERAKVLNTERGYIDFIEQFPLAAQQDRAHELRNEVAYIDALKENTYQSYLGFLTRYPESARAGEARERYESLLFEASTKDRTLASYESFLKEYPASPYRPVAVEQIFEISTASGKSGAFLEFIKRFPESKQAALARNIVYHILLEEEKTIPSMVLTDSIRNVRRLEQGFLVPFLKDGLFGFMNANGREIIKPFSEDLDAYYLCGNIIEDILVAGGKVIGRDGSVLFTGEVTEIDDLGYGFILASADKCSWLIHKSGIRFDDCVDDARVVGGSYLAIRKNGKWILKTFSGRVLPMDSFEGIESMDEVLIFRMSGKYRLARKDDLANVADQKELMLSRAYDEVKRWTGNAIWVRSGESQGLIDFNLRERIALGRKEILPSFFGAVSRTPEGSRAWSSAIGLSEIFQDVQVQSPWIAARKENRWLMLDVQTFKPIVNELFDTIYFAGAYSMCQRGDSLRAYYTSTRYIPLTTRLNLHFLPGRDSTFYLMIEEGDKKTVYDYKGTKLFTANYDRIEFAGDDLFLVVRREKRGLISLAGKPVIPLEYDAMGTMENGSLPVLKNKKFGFVDVVHRKEIKVLYEKNLVRYNRNYLIAFKGGSVGIIDWNNKNVLPFEYEEIRYWSDSSALVKKNFQWMIYNFVEKKVLADKIRSFKWLRDSGDEKLIIVNQDGNFGVISSLKGFVLASTYSDILNIGSAAQPLYFTEKHVEEASIYVVIYYDEHGKLIRRQVFEVEDYERIYCTNN